MSRKQKAKLLFIITEPNFFSAYNLTSFNAEDARVYFHAKSVKFELGEYTWKTEFNLTDNEGKKVQLEKVFTGNPEYFITTLKRMKDSIQFGVRKLTTGNTLFVYVYDGKNITDAPIFNAVRNGDIGAFNNITGNTIENTGEPLKCVDFELKSETPVDKIPIQVLADTVLKSITDIIKTDKMSYTKEIEDDGSWKKMNEQLPLFSEV